MGSSIQVKRIADAILENVGKVIYGKEKETKLLLTAMLAGGHVLLDDIPGTGKTTLAKALAKSVGCGCGRIQFTPDLLPSDITGINYYNQKSGEFVFRRGPLFTNIVIADEINRTTPRTQSALLECMEERQTTVDGVTYPLEAPFFVIATQNPLESQGTFPLPEAQIDRFLMRLSLGYPDAESEKNLLREQQDTHPLTRITAVCTKEELLSAQEALPQITVSDAVRDYIVRIADATRNTEKIRVGISPRGSLALMRASRAYAAISGRDYVLPDDVKGVAVPVIAHRIIAKSQNTIRMSESSENIVEYLISKVAAPID